MGVVWGVVILVVGLVAWGGQTLSLVAPQIAERYGLTETEASVAPAFYADVRGEALWDALTLWVLPVAGVLLIADAAAWPYFGLAGGAVYTYFGGRGIAARRAMQARQLPIGNPATVGSAYAALALWGVAGLATVIAAIVRLAG